MRTIILLCIGLIISSFSNAQQTVGLFLNEPDAYNGYTLFSNNETTYLIDNCGYTVNIWESEHDPGLSVYLLENGNLLRTAEKSGEFSGGGLGGRFELFSWENELLWEYEYVSDQYHPHHDIEPLPNGNFLAIVWEEYSAAEAEEAGYGFDDEIWLDKIIEIEMVGNNQANIVWEWKLYDHLIQEHNIAKQNYGIISEHPELVHLNYFETGFPPPRDLVHANGISYHSGLDQIAISTRGFSEIWVIDHSTTTAQAASHTGGNYGKGGDILYRFGNPQTYQRGTADDQVFFRQHDVRWVPAEYPNGNKMMVFNNLAASFMSRVDIWQPPIDIEGNYEIETNEAFGPDEFIWQYSDLGFYSAIMSGAHPLPNGNILICEAKDGFFFEVNPEKEIVWEYVNPVNKNGSPVSQGGTPMFNDVFRATKYPEDYAAFIGRELIPGPPVEIIPWDIECEIYQNVVGVNDEKSENEITILGNPVSGFLNLFLNIDGKEKEAILFNTYGAVSKRFYISEGINSEDISGLPNGMYLLKIDIENSKGYVFKIIKI